MTWTSSIRAVLFDFDGTLADTERLHYEAFSGVLSGLQLSLSWDMYRQHCLGFDDAGVIRFAYAQAGRRCDDRVLQQMIADKAAEYDRQIRSEPLFPGVIELLRDLSSRMPIAIVSMADGVQIRQILEAAGVSKLLATVVAAQQVTAPKPDPQGYLKACEYIRLRYADALTPGECLVVEDSEPGMRAGKAAGMRVAAVTTTLPRSQLAQADVILDHVTEVRTLLQTSVAGA